MALLAGSPAISAGGALTTLSSAISSSATTIPVGLASAIASTPGSYVIEIDGEQMLVTNVNLTTNTLTVVRGYNGTTAASHNAGAGVYLPFDQRGVGRLVPPDIGAYQYSVPKLVVSASPTSLSAGGTTSVTITAENQDNTVLTNFSDSVTLSDSLGAQLLGRIIHRRRGHGHGHAGHAWLANDYRHRSDGFDLRH